MHISILLFWFIIISVAGFFCFLGYILNDLLSHNEREDIMVLEYGITDRDNKIKELESKL